MIVSLVASAINLYPWHLSWERQQLILSDIDEFSFADVPSGDAILLNEPLYICGVEVFAASWDISSAVYAKTKQLDLYAKGKVPGIYPMYLNVPVVWDGSGILMLRCGVS